jgi:MarR family transcriptional regulator, organic hydroperoxide resistance regulator
MRKRARQVTPAVTNDDRHQLDRSLDFMRLLWSVEHRLQSASKRMESSIGITGPQRLALRIVAQFPGLSAKELARIVHLHPSTISGILHRLVGKGWLEREDDPADRRRVRLRVKPQARRFSTLASGTVESSVAKALSRLPREHVRRAREVLWAIATELDEARE